MIIQCEKCQARFRLDDSKVTDKGAKVRCTKCKCVFTVQKKEPAIESSESVTALAGFSFPVDQDEAPPASSESQHYAADFSSFDISSPEEPAASFEADDSFGDVTGNAPASVEEPSGEEKEIDFSSFDISSPEEPSVSFETDETYGDTGNAPASAEESAVEEKEIDFSSFDTSSSEEPGISFETDETYGDITGSIPASTEASAVEESEVDFSGFSFDEDETTQESAPLSTTSTDSFAGREGEPVATEPQKREVRQGLDFSDDAMFGAVVEADQEPSSDTISFDFGNDSYAESIDTGGQDSSSKSGTSFSFDSHADTPFNLGEIDFGDDLTSVAVQQVNPDDLKPSQEILFAPLAEAKSKTTVDTQSEAFRRETPSGDQDELPPLSIPSRRKQSPLYSGMIALGALLVIMVVGYFGYSSFSSRSDTASQDTGKIGIRALTASYVDNDEAGELLVISGEALNEYPQPRASLQVIVTLFDADGQSLVTKSAYGGNPLTEEQLESLPLEKIEAAMANQFGDSLANMEVAPGKAIPFVVVLAKLPKGAKDFDVQSAGSTVATGKQQ